MGVSCRTKRDSRAQHVWVQSTHLAAQARADWAWRSTTAPEKRRRPDEATTPSGLRDWRRHSPSMGKARSRTTNQPVGLMTTLIDEPSSRLIPAPLKARPGWILPQMLE